MVWKKIVNEFHKLTHGKFKKTYFKRHPKESKLVSTVRFYFNIFSSTPNLQYSNFNFEDPQGGWIEMTPSLKSSFRRFRYSVHEIFVS